PGARAPPRARAAAVGQVAALPSGPLAVRAAALRPLPRPGTLGRRMSNPLASVAPDLAPAPPAVEPPRPQRRDRSAAWRRQFLAEGPVDVTVCIANWNCRDLLRACLESLHDREQGVALETVVVDNASADGAADMVADEFPEVVLVRNAANLGFSRAN